MDADDNYIPFSIRFKAWWEGLDPKALIAPRSEDDNPLAIEVDDAPDPNQQWTQGRIAFCRRLCEITDKDEVVDPGGAEYTFWLFKPMSLTSQVSAVDLSAGLGGGTRKTATDLNTYIDGYEMDSELAELAHALSVKHGVERRIPIAAYDPETFELPERKFNGILCRERLFRITNKDRFLGMTFNALRPRGHFVMTDFVLKTESDATDPTISAWLPKAANGSSLWTAEDYRATLTRLGMDIRIQKDETDEYRSMLLKAWSQFVVGLSKADLTRDFINDMMREAEYWLMLIRALESGKLRYVRLHAIRGGELT